MPDPNMKVTFLEEMADLEALVRIMPKIDQVNLRHAKELLKLRLNRFRHFTISVSQEEALGDLERLASLRQGLSAAIPTLSDLEGIDSIIEHRLDTLAVLSPRAHSGVRLAMVEQLSELTIKLPEIYSGYIQVLMAQNLEYLTSSDNAFASRLILEVILFLYTLSSFY